MARAARTLACVLFAVAAAGPVAGQVAPPVVTGVATARAAAEEGEPVTFTARVENPGGGALTYTWDPGDGSAPVAGDSGAPFIHAFRDDGQFTVTVTVAGEGGEARGTATVTVSNVAPRVRVLTGPDGAAVGEPVSFEGLARDPGSADVLTYAWDFGTGAVESGEDRTSVRHRFDEPGIYTVRLTVSDDEGLSAERTLIVPVDRTFAFSMSGAVGGTIVGGDQERPGFLAHGPDRAGEIPDGFCQLSLTARETRTSVTLGGLLPSPIRPGTYPIAREGGPGVFRVQDLQCGNPGADCANGLWRGSGVAGTVSITEAGAGRVTGSVQAEMLFGDAAYGLSGIFTAAPTRMAGVALGLDPGCFRNVRFAIERHRPETNQPNVDPRDPAIEVAFTAPLDRTSVSPNTFVVELRLPDGQDPGYRRIEGVIDYPDEGVLRFTPAEPLPGAVLPCVRVRAGRDGVRSEDGDTLGAADPVDPMPELDAAARQGREPVLSRTARACLGGGRPWPGAHEFGFATLVDPDEVRVDLYQVAKVENEIQLVPGKPTAARVFTRWVERADVHPDAQVIRFPARVRLEAAGRTDWIEDRIEIRRPDTYTAEERRLARNSVNFFGWKPEGDGPSVVKARIEPLDQTATPPTILEGASEPAEHWPHAPRFRFDYYFLRIGAWTPGLPALPESRLDDATRAAGHLLAKRTEEYTTQLFPILSAHARGGHDFFFDLAEQAGAEGREAGARLMDVIGLYHGHPAGFRGDLAAAEIRTNLATFARIFTDQVAPFTDANALVAFVPATLDEGGTAHLSKLLEEAGKPGGESVPFRTVHINPRGDIHLTTALTHEFGHSFWLEHDPPVDDANERTRECARSPRLLPGIDGMRMRADGMAGWSKSSVDGNAEAPGRLYPLMYPCSKRVEESFITGRAYAALQEDIAAAIRLGFYEGAAVAPGGGGAQNDVDGGASPTPPAAPQRPFGPDPFPELPPPKQPTGPASATPIGSQERAVLLVSGFMGGGPAADGDWAYLGPVRRAPRALASASIAEGPYRLVLSDEAGSTLRSATFGLLTDEDPARDGSGYFSLTVPAVEGVHAFTILRDGVEIGRRTVSASVPVVHILEPAAAPLAADPRTLRWESSDADGDDLLVSVLYSPNGTAPWRATGLFRGRTELPIDPAQLEPGDRPTLRVVASDGFHEGTADVRIRLTETVRELARPNAPPAPATAEREPLPSPRPAPAPDSDRAPADAVALTVGARHEVDGGHSLTVHAIDRRVEGILGMMGGREAVTAAVLDVEVCAGDTAFTLPHPAGGLFGLRTRTLSGPEVRHGWSGDGVLWNGRPTFGRPMLDPAVPAGTCVRGPVPIAEPARAEVDAVIFDGRPFRSALPAAIATLVAWVLPR